MKRLTALLSVIVLLASCEKSGTKKVYVLSEGTADINTNDRTITTKGRGHEEKEVLFYDDGKITLNVSSQAGKAEVALPDDGIYILNTKKDTIVGSFVNYAAPKTEVKHLSDAELAAYVDSLQQIVSGNAKAGKTFYILPNQAVKITSNMDATVITPYHQMTSIEYKKGQSPEVYRFYPISESRATLDKLKTMTGDKGDKPVND